MSVSLGGLGGPLGPLGEKQRACDIVAPAAVGSSGEDTVADSKVAPALSASVPISSPRAAPGRLTLQLSFLHPHPHCHHHHRPENISARSCFISHRAPPFVTIFVPVANLTVPRLPVETGTHWEIYF